jgi:hypothetical protein
MWCRWLMPKGMRLVAHSVICCSHSSQYEDWGRDAVCFGRKTSVPQSTQHDVPYKSPPLVYIRIHMNRVHTL